MPSQVAKREGALSSGWAGSPAWALGPASSSTALTTTWTLRAISYSFGVLSRPPPGCGNGPHGFLKGGRACQLFCSGGPGAATLPQVEAGRHGKLGFHGLAAPVQ